MRLAIVALLLAGSAFAQDRPGEPRLEVGRKEGLYVVYLRTTGYIECDLAWARLKKLSPAPVDLSCAIGTGPGVYAVQCSAKAAPDPLSLAGVLKAAGVKRVVLDARGPVAVKDGKATFTLEACRKSYPLRNRARRKDEKSDPPDLVGTLADGATPWIVGELQDGALVVESVD